MASRTGAVPPDSPGWAAAWGAACPALLIVPSNKAPLSPLDPSRPPLDRIPHSALSASPCRPHLRVSALSATGARASGPAAVREPGCCSARRTELPQCAAASAPCLCCVHPMAADALLLLLLLFQGDAAGDGFRPFGGAQREAGQALRLVAPTTGALHRHSPTPAQPYAWQPPAHAGQRPWPGPARGSQRYKGRQEQAFRVGPFE